MLETLNTNDENVSNPNSFLPIDLNSNEDWTNLSIDLGSSKIPRVRCFNHVLNTIVRNAIDESPKLKRYIWQLNRLVQSSKNKHDLVNIFDNLKARLRYDNTTRWGSTFLLFESVAKAYEKGIFSKNNVELPVSIQIIKNYLRILKPVYIMNLAMQKIDASICDVLPFLRCQIRKLEKLKRKNTTDGKRFIELLLEKINYHFEYEFNSQIYLAASLMRTDMLKYWQNTHNVDLFNKALESINDVYFALIYDESQETQVQDNQVENELEKSIALAPLSSSGSSDSLDYAKGFFKEADLTKETTTKMPCSRFLTIHELKKEVVEFEKLITDINFKSSKMTTREFWLNHETKFPHLTQLAKCVLNTCASSAFIERFFSICGAICDQRSNNISSELFIMRSILKANQSLLAEMNGYCNNKKAQD